MRTVLDAKFDEVEFKCSVLIGHSDEYGRVEGTQSHRPGCDFGFYRKLVSATGLYGVVRCTSSCKNAHCPSPGIPRWGHQHMVPGVWQKRRMLRRYDIKGLRS
jgi:hypothetical protein